MRIVICLLALCAPQWALAHTLQGELRVSDEAVDLVTRTNTYRLVSPEPEQQRLLAALRAHLDGEQVTLEGRLYMSARGPYLVPSDLVAPVRTTIVASHGGRTFLQDSWRYRHHVAWRGLRLHATGLAPHVPAHSSRLDVFLFGDPQRGAYDRVHVVSIWGEARRWSAGFPPTSSVVPGWIRDVQVNEHHGWIPLPPGNPTTLWAFTTRTYRFNDDGSDEVREVSGMFVEALPAVVEAEEALTGAVEVPEGQGLADVLRQTTAR